MIGRKLGRKLMMKSAVVCTVIGGAAMGTSLAQKTSVPKQPNPLVLAKEKVREILQVMHTDANGRISKQEWMKFMEAEFDSLDPSKKGELDPKELQPSPSSARHFNHAIAGK